MSTLEDRERITAAVQELASCYPRFGLSPANLAAYVKHLAKVPPDRLASTLDQLAETSTFFPTIAEILRAANPADERTNLSPVYTAEVLERMIGLGATDVVRSEIAASTILTSDERDHLARLLLGVVA